MTTTVKWIAALFLLAAAFGVGNYWRGQTDIAATAITLNQQVKDRDKILADTSTKIGTLSAELIKSNNDRTALEMKLASWQESEAGQLSLLEKNGNETVATKNPVCWPTDDERRMRNETVRTFTDKPGAIASIFTKGY